MSYTLPQVQVFQESSLIPSAVAEPLYACIVGAHGQLFRFNEPSEKADTSLGEYDYLTNTGYGYPNQPTDSIVDISYVALYADDAYLLYHEDETAGGYGAVNPDATYHNRITSDTVSYIDNEFGGVTYPRHASLLDRDCAVGDSVHVTGTVAMVEYDLWTTIKGFHGVVVPAVVDAVEVGDDNEPSHIGDPADISQTDGDENCIVATADSTNYEGSVEGDIRETYVVTVTQGSTGGDLTTALLRVRTQSGHDDVDDVVPSAAGVATAIGTRGLEVTFDVTSLGSCSLEAITASLSPDDLLEGQEWTIFIVQAFTPPTATSGGTYTGDTDTTYIVTVSRGGPFAGVDKPQLTVTTTTGSDISGPTDVTGTGVAVVVGSRGVTITFSGVGVDRLCAGDLWYIPVHAAGEGAMTTIELNHTLPIDLQNPVIDLSLELYIVQQGIEIPAEAVTPGSYNYTYDADSITVYSGIELYDSTWTDAGIQQPLPLIYADLYVEYRAWLCEAGDTLYSCADEDELDAITGQEHPDNPLKWAISKALLNSNGTPIQYIAVCDPDDADSWQAAIDTLSGRRNVYGIVPLTYDTTILAAFITHVAEQSVSAIGRPRVLWINAYVDPTVVIADDTNSEDLAILEATISEDPGNPGQFTIVEVPSANAQFETLGVRAGDVMRYNYTTDAWGNTEYDEYVIDEVLGEDSLKLLSGQGMVNEPVAKLMQVWRNRTVADTVDTLSETASGYLDPRIRYVWPDTVGDDDYDFEGWHLCAALAGLRSGVVPHQGLTNLEILGFSDVTRTDDLFTRAQLDTMAADGVWFVTQNDNDDIVSRHAITTAGYGELETQEEMIVTNQDSINYGFRTTLEALFGITNVTESTIEVATLALNGKIAYYRQTFVPRLGPQLIDGSVVSISPHTLLGDRLVINTTLTLPAPLNNVDMYQELVI